jgi:hypothetical protein
MPFLLKSVPSAQALDNNLAIKSFDITMLLATVIGFLIIIEA